METASRALAPMRRVTSFWRSVTLVPEASMMELEPTARCRVGGADVLKNKPVVASPAKA